MLFLALRWSSPHGVYRLHGGDPWFKEEKTPSPNSVGSDKAVWLLPLTHDQFHTYLLILDPGGLFFSPAEIIFQATDFSYFILQKNVDATPYAALSTKFSLVTKL